MDFFSIPPPTPVCGCAKLVAPFCLVQSAFCSLLLGLCFIEKHGSFESTFHFDVSDPSFPLFAIAYQVRAAPPPWMLQYDNEFSFVLLERGSESCIQEQMKEHIAKLSMLTAPEEQKELIVYLAASKEAVSAVLMTEREARQMPIYFPLVHASKRLKRYFQAHPITVITDQPIKNILSNPKVAGRMQKWSIQLGEFGIHYRPRVFVKGQVLADFIVERPEDKGHDNSPNEEEPLPAWWTLFTDGSSCVDGCRAGVILTDPEGMEFTHALRF
ncbi:hypothetical protein Tco_0008213 [Tanacetum coccineum]